MKKQLISNYDDRQYMLSEDFELYYYQDKKAVKRTGLHSHPYYEFYFFLEGNIEAQIHNDCYILSYGDILVIPPYTTHGIFVKNFNIPYRRFDLWINTEFYEKLSKTSSDFTYFIDLARNENCYILHTEPISFNSILSKLYILFRKKKETGLDVRRRQS
ncbi:MAG: cupin domain-containing protein [Lachnospiraceae bacterium]|nr:cupin domain-containing protein [Lachnospiraceae bacterium]